MTAIRSRSGSKVTSAKVSARATFTTNVEGTARLCRAALASGVRKFVYVSSIQVISGYPLDVQTLRPSDNGFVFGLPDVYGARLTGGGFGGAVVMLARAGTGETVSVRIAETYAARSGRPPTCGRALRQGGRL